MHRRHRVRVGVLRVEAAGHVYEDHAYSARRFNFFAFCSTGRLASLAHDDRAGRDDPRHLLERAGRAQRGLRVGIAGVPQPHVVLQMNAVSHNPAPAGVLLRSFL
jgi:hypothetical protein